MGTSWHIFMIFQSPWRKSPAPHPPAILFLFKFFTYNFFWSNSRRYSKSEATHKDVQLLSQVNVYRFSFLILSCEVKLQIFSNMPPFCLKFFYFLFYFIFFFLGSMLTMPSETLLRIAARLDLWNKQDTECTDCEESSIFV